MDKIMEGKVRTQIQIQTQISNSNLNSNVEFKFLLATTYFLRITANRQLNKDRFAEGEKNKD
ncbi:hypothetical protein [Maribacter sp. 2-571]|uniref:hypothetical protein n=1 Tax=Maribacter sp. 2-571 TaxID=3417569 RepID=UPI003D33F05D